MATTARQGKRTEAEIRKAVEVRVAQVKQQLADEQLQARYLEEIVLRVEAYEQQFGMRSEDVGPAIDAGELVEDLDVCNWLLAYKRLKRIGAR